MKFNETKIVELLCKQRNQITQEDSEYLMGWLTQTTPDEHQRLFGIADRIDRLAQG